MIRNLLVLLVFLGVSFGAGVAQSDIFLRQSPKAESKEEGGDKVSKKRGIFLRPFKKDSPKTSNVQTRFQAKLNVKGVRRQVEKDLKTLNYWRERETKPQNIEEMRSYAFALRVGERTTMLKERELERVAMVNLKRKHEVQFQKYLLARNPNAMAANAVAEKKSTVHTNYRGEASTTKKRVKRIYRKKEQTLEKPSRVIRDYR